MKITFQPSALESALASMQACSEPPPPMGDEHISAELTQGAGAGAQIGAESEDDAQA